MSRRWVIRSFAFLDLCGFTAYMDDHGHDAAIEALVALRVAIRAAAEDHGVRIAKWLGDGSMLVGMEHEAVLDCVLAVQERLAPATGPPLRGGLSTGRVLLFEGDDHVGPAVNIAARLCAGAAPGQILVSDLSSREESDSASSRSICVRGVSGSIPIRAFESPARH